MSDSDGERFFQTSTQYFVEVNRPKIVFGKSAMFPGSIEEVDLTIGLKNENIDDQDSEPYVLRVIAHCNNEEFDNLDEYVFSVRSSERLEYYEEIRFKIRKNEKANVRVAVKLPQVKENCSIQGCLEVKLENLTSIFIPISVQCNIPEVQCVKDLFKLDQGTSMIKVLAKRRNKVAPIAFKNLSRFDLEFQIGVLSNQNFSQRPCDIVAHKYTRCPAGGTFFVNLGLKENMEYRGQIPLKDFIRKILVLRIKDSSVCYNYPMQVVVSENSTF